MNVEITIPGVTDPAHVVVIGCHYDGEADSTQSALDDASGCAIELGVAQAMARFWRSRGLYPSRTLRFVIFDAEEEGIIGSFSYVNGAANGSLPEIAAMFNEEQSGIGYPLRFLGKLANPLLPTDLLVAPIGPNSMYPALGLSAAQAAGNLAFARLLKRAVAAAFGTFRGLGYQELSYHGPGGRPVFRPIFTPGQLDKLPVESDTLGSSDQMAFTMAGIPDATFVTSAGYYGQAPPAGSYPFDQPQDTIALMNTYADGGVTRSAALSLALAVPGMLTAWMLTQPGILGQARPGERPVAAIASVPRVRPGRTVTLRATAYDPGSPHASLRYSWIFGDGAKGGGQVVRHSYRASGRYSLKLTVTAPGQAARVITQSIAVGLRASYRNPYLTGRGTSRQRSRAVRAAQAGTPLPNPLVTLPAGNSGLTDKVRRAAAVSKAAPARSSSVAWILTGVAVIAVVAAAVVLASLRRRGRLRPGR